MPGLLALFPEIAILLLAVLVMALDLLLGSRGGRRLGQVTAAGLAIIFISSLFASLLPGPAQIFGSMLRSDALAHGFRLIVLFASMITALISMDVPGVGDRGEYYGLMLVSTLGMDLMAGSSDLVMLYLAIETTSIPLYLLSGYFRGERRSVEAGLKYFLFGAAASAVMLFGFSWLYGFSGETSLVGIAKATASGHLPLTLWVGSAVLVLVGFGFKVSAVPFHFWAPDVYEGAPTPITAFISTASKAAGFAVLARVMLSVFTPVITPYWGALIAAMAVASMTLGNILALAQQNLKRLLAYSSIAHAGYALVGLAALSSLGLAGTIFYLAAYVITNLAAFAIVIVVSRTVGSDDVARFAGLSRRSPGLALALLVSLLSLAGIPPFAGFVGKVFVFAAAVQSGLVWLAIVGVLNSIVGLYYYLIVLKVVYLFPSEDEGKPMPIPVPARWALGLTIAGILVVGVVSGPWFGWAMGAARVLF
ncbi:MAG: NADH-quinone oxidoreductase subunit N [Anaerolineales bacterium]|jgi:NADH-quinone oxidoreductase subunit N